MEKSDYIFGMHTIIEAILSGKEIEKILIKKGLQGELYRELMDLVHQMQIPIQLVPIEKIDRVTRKNHQGVLAFISPIAYQNIEEIIPRLYEEGKNPLILILDEITDVRNFGAIARSAEVAGVDAIVIPEKGSAQINADAIKTSAGALHLIPVCRTKSLSMVVKYLKNSGLKIVAATDKGEKYLFDVAMKDPLAIILGSEDLGIEAGLLKVADEWAKIPQFGQIKSLNVSVAAGIMIFEAIRQRTSQSL
ncbi:MAG: 23S rRNA (guanosine(2251)-2'-O)-methyltransferase RlmB [Mariniphaga sp.]